LSTQPTAALLLLVGVAPRMEAAFGMGGGGGGGGGGGDAVVAHAEFENDE